MKNLSKLEKQMHKAKVFIDGANIFYTQKDLGWTIDWKKTVDFLKERWEILDIKYYTGIKLDDDKMRN